jgi:hypothetical protein
MSKTNWTPLLFILKNHGINVKDYDYKEGVTNVKKMMNGDHPFLMYQRRFYMNPYLWARMLEEDIEDAIKYIIEQEEFSPDLVVVNGCLGCSTKENKYPTFITLKYLQDTKKEDNYDDIADAVIRSVAESGRYLTLL